MTSLAVPALAPRPSPSTMAVWMSSPQPATNKHEAGGKPLKPLPTSLAPSNPVPAGSRKERPCDACRRRKSKCVIQESRRCVLCDFHKQDCTFVEKAQPRKRKADHDPPPLPPPPQSRPDSVAAPTLANKSRLPKSDRHPRPVPPPAPALLVDDSLSLQRHRHCRLLGHTTPLDASLIALAPFDHHDESASRLGTMRRVTAFDYFTIHPDADPDADTDATAPVPIPDDEARALSDIEALVGLHAPALVDVYFRHVHPRYPILHKHVFLYRHRHGDRRFNPPLLAAVYFLALAWYQPHPRLAHHPPPDPVRLEALALSTLAVAMQRPKISAVQAGLLLFQRVRSVPWSLLVQLVALGQDIGLHLDCSHWSIPLWERRLRKRLAWALYMQDKWSALVYGRPSHINPADWAVPPPAPDDFDEAMEPLASPELDADSDDYEAGGGMVAHMLRGQLLFTQMIALTAIMAEVCETFYSQTAQADFARAGRYATSLVLSRAKPVQIKLRDWFAKLPSDCKMDSVAPNTFSSAGDLHLAYFATEISIHRRIVQCLDPATADSYMLYICRSAAKTRLISAMDFANRLRPEHLDAFWTFASASNFALIGTFGALLQATSPGREEAGFYAARMNEFKWTLGISAKRAAWIRPALDMLAVTTDMLEGLPEKPVAAVSQTHVRGREHGPGKREDTPGQAAQLRPFSPSVAGSGGVEDGLEMDTTMEEMMTGAWEPDFI